MSLQEWFPTKSTQYFVYKLTSFIPRVSFPDQFLLKIDCKESNHVQVDRKWTSGGPRFGWDPRPGERLKKRNNPQ